LHLPTYRTARLNPVTVPGSKSVSNRALLLAAMAPGRSRISGGLEADDTRRMRDCLGSLEIHVQRAGETWVIQGGAAPNPSGVLEVGASGTTLRFLLPWLALKAKNPVHFHGDSRLFERPLGGLLSALSTLGVSWNGFAEGGVLHPVPSPISHLDLAVDSSASSQFLTGLAMAAACLPDGGQLRWLKPPPSTSYLQLTLHCLEMFGCSAQLNPERWIIPGHSLTARNAQIPGDWSGAAAFLCAGAVLGLPITASPLDPADPQGDRAILAVLGSAGCQVDWLDSQTVCVRGPLRRGFETSLDLCPDLGPVLTATAALAPEPSVLTGLQTLPHKECDRLEASAELVRWLGGEATVVGDHTLRIVPGPRPGNHPPFDPRNDHRMAFAAAVGALRCGGELLNPGCVAKTLPTFWDDWNAMLGIAP